MARLVVPGYPHHVTQRGCRRQQTFFGSADYQSYKDLLARYLGEAKVDVWAYCLMPNHVHLILLPHEKDSLATLMRETHSRYARKVNKAHGWRGHLWQERFYSFVMDEDHLFAALRYVEMNPVRAGLCRHADDWRWSSVHTHLHQFPDQLMPTNPMGNLIPNWREFLGVRESEQVIDTLREHSSSGRPAGNNQFVDHLEMLTSRQLRRKKPTCQRTRAQPRS